MGMDVSFWLEILLNLVLKGSLILILGFIAARLLSGSSASSRSFLWTAIILFLLFTPLISYLPDMFSWNAAGENVDSGNEQLFLKINKTFDDGVEEEFRVAGENLTAKRMLPAEDLATSKTTSGGKNIFNWPLILVSIWISGVIIMMMSTLYKFQSSRSLINKSCSLDAGDISQAIAIVRRKLQIRKQVEYILCDKVTIPCVAGFFKPVLILPEDATTWEKNKLISVIFHELGHVRRSDIFRLAALELACAINWINPLVWLAAKNLKLEIENACDDYVINAGVKNSSYARQLFEFIVLLNNAEKPPTGVMTMARKSTLEKRVVNILSEKNRRKPMGIAGTLLISLALILTLVPLTAMRFLDSSSVNTAVNYDDREDLDRILRYFPYTGYQEIYHKDFAALRKAENAKVFSRLFEPEHQLYRMIMETIPEKDQKKLTSLTVAKTIRTVVLTTVEGKVDERGMPFAPELNTAEGKKKFRGARLNMFEQDKQTLFANVGETIATLRYQGQILKEVGPKSEEKILDGRTATRLPGGFWMYQPEEGVILMAQRFEDLKKMIEAGNIDTTPLMETTSISELTSYYQDLGPIWQLQSFTGNYDYERQFYKNKVDDPDVPANLKTNYNTILTNLARVEQKKPIVFIVNTFKVGKEIEKVTMELCGDKQAADRRFDKSWINTSTRPDWGFETYMKNYSNVPASKEFHDALEKKVSRTLDKNLITARATIDEGLLKLAREAREGIDDWRQEEKGKRASEKKN